MKQSKDFVAPLNYSTLVFRHMERMSVLMVEGLAVNDFHTKALTAYYLAVQHLENLLSIHLTKEYFEEKKKIMKGFPPFSDSWEGDLGKSVAFIRAAGLWFQLLLTVANSEELITFQAKTYDESDEFEKTEKPTGR